MTELFSLLSKLADKGAAGLVILIVAIFIWFLLRLNKDTILERDKERVSRTAEREADDKSRQEEREASEKMRSAMITEFKVELGTQRVEFFEGLNRLSDRHESLQNQVVELVKDSNKVGLQMSTAITELRDEMRQIKQKA